MSCLWLEVRTKGSDDIQLVPEAACDRRDAAGALELLVLQWFSRSVRAFPVY